jgi:sugar O-acyltransferase (sialic acid O-acetyltransferase NeuD family)
MKRALFGHGGHAREVMTQMGEIIPCFVDDQYVTEKTLPISSFDPDEYEIMIAVANSRDRFDISCKLPEKTKYFSWVHPTALLIGNDIEIGDGSFVGAYSIITTNIKIGKHAILNRFNQIGHDCVIGDFFSMMPGSIVSGNVIIGDVVYIGNNASIREKISINNFVTIGMNGAVVKDITESGVYVGVPTKKKHDNIL